jgi:curved DNA-binding protein
VVKFKDYYEVLGVPRTATDKEIKAAYRKLARQHHPDANKGNKASEERFKEIGEAYEVLKDPAKRQRYDQLGSSYKDGSDFRPPPGYTGAGAGPGGFTFDFGSMGRGGQAGGAGGGAAFSDFFEMLFGQSFGTQAGSQFGGMGGMGSMGGGIPPGMQTGGKRRDQELDIELTVEELSQGTTRTIQITEPGAKARTLEVKIPAGVRAGSKIRVAGEGGKSMGGPVDLFLKVQVKPHEYFTIDGDNLICEINLSPAQAVLGAEAAVNTLDGSIRIRIPAGTQNGRLLRLRGRGLPKLKGGTKGDQLVRAKIVIPAAVTAQEKALYEQLAALEKDKVGAAT